MSRIDDMTRLHDHVQAGHRTRKSLVAFLVSGGAERRVTVGAVRRANVAENDERSRSLMASLLTFMGGLTAQEKGRRQAAARAHKSRVTFIKKLERDVASLAHGVALTRQANRAENAASSAAWTGVAVVASGKRSAKSSRAAA